MIRFISSNTFLALSLLSLLLSSTFFYSKPGSTSSPEISIPNIYAASTIDFHLKRTPCSLILPTSTSFDPSAIQELLENKDFGVTLLSIEKTAYPIRLNGWTLHNGQPTFLLSINSASKTFIGRIGDFCESPHFTLVSFAVMVNRSLKLTIYDHSLNEEVTLTPQSSSHSDWLIKVTPSNNPHKIITINSRMSFELNNAIYSIHQFDPNTLSLIIEKTDASKNRSKKHFSLLKTNQ